MGMGVEQSDGCGGVFRILELADTLFQTSDVFAQNLRSCLALAIVVLASVGFLGLDALLTSWFGTIATLQTRRCQSLALVARHDRAYAPFCAFGSANKHVLLPCAII